MLFEVHVLLKHQQELTDTINISWTRNISSTWLNPFIWWAQLLTVVSGSYTYFITVVESCFNWTFNLKHQQAYVDRTEETLLFFYRQSFDFHTEKEGFDTFKQTSMKHGLPPAIIVSAHHVSAVEPHVFTLTAMSGHDWPLVKFVGVQR